MIDINIKNWIHKFNLDHKLFYSNFTVPKIEYKIICKKINLYYMNKITNNYILEKDKYNENNNLNLKIDSDLFFKETSLSKWDYILQNYFNHFNINKFSKLLFVNVSIIDLKNKINNYYNIDNYQYKLNKKITLSKKYDLISIFGQDYKMPNSKKNYNYILLTIMKILENILTFVNKDTIIHIFYFHTLTAQSIDFIYLLENYFDLSFFSEYKLQDIDKTSIDIILSNGRNLNVLKRDLKNIIKILNLKNNYTGFIKYEYIPRQSSFFVFKHICDFLNKRYIQFLKLHIKNNKKIIDIYKKIILNQIFTQDVKNTNVMQMPTVIQLLNKESTKSFKVGNILYNFILKNKINKIFQFGFYNGYLSIFILTALNTLKSSNKELITIDSRQKEYYKNKGLKLFQKLNIFKNHILIQDYIYNYIPELILQKKKFKMIILHNILVENFQELMIEFYFALKIIDKNGYIYLEKINFPKIKKMINYIKCNLFFLNIYYENFFKNIIIFKVKDNKALELYLSNNPNKEDRYYFKDF